MHLFWTQAGSKVGHLIQCRGAKKEKNIRKKLGILQDIIAEIFYSGPYCTLFFGKMQYYFGVAIIFVVFADKSLMNNSSSRELEDIVSRKTIKKWLTFTKYFCHGAFRRRVCGVTKGR